MLSITEVNKLALKTLLQLEDELSKRLESLSADMTKSHDPDSSEQAVERENDEVIAQLENDTRVELQQVRHAMKRLEQGTYHDCAICGDEISLERLTAIPYTQYCIDCADTV